MVGTHACLLRMSGESERSVDSRDSPRGARKKFFSKCLHPLHPLHPPKLSEVRSSFGVGCTFEKSFLHRICTRRTPFDWAQGRLPLRPFDGDEFDASEQPASVCVAVSTLKISHTEL